MATKEQRKAAYFKLSEEARDFASSQDVSDIVNSLCKKHAISPEKQDLLDTLVYETLIGIYLISDFQSKTRTILSESEEKVGSVCAEVREKIFNPFLEIEKKHQTVVTGINIKDSTLSAKNEPRVREAGTSSIPLQKEEKPFSILINQGEKLIEDSKGNADNVIPGATKPVVPNPGTPFQKTISSQTPTTIAPSAENVILKKPYPGQDPYREPPKP